MYAPNRMARPVESLGVRQTSGDSRAGLAEWLIAFPAPGPMLSMNDGDSWKVRALAADWRDRAYFAWVEQFPGEGPSGRSIPPAEVFVTLPFPNRRRRDPINFAKTVKHIVDGIQMAGAWPDDTPDWVTQHIPTLTIVPGGQVLIRVIERASG